MVMLHLVNHSFKAQSLDDLQKQYTFILEKDTLLSSPSASASPSPSPSQEIEQEDIVQNTALKRKAAYLQAKKRMLNAPPFILNHEILRATIVTGIAALGYLLMLAVMVGFTTF